MESVKIVVITGLSGSGKSTAIRALEDLDYFCIDNLPVVLLPKFLELGTQSRHSITHLGLVIDVRDQNFLSTASDTFEAVRKDGHNLEIVFLEASLDTLVRRYSETRRKHPLAQQGPVREGIEAEQEQLNDLRHMARYVLDTSSMTVHDLRREIQALYNLEQSRRMTVNILSFGFKNGVPAESDLVFDVRFLQNPHFIPALRAQTGLDPLVSRYVLSQKNTQILLTHLFELLGFLLPLYEAEGKNYLTIALGCTGGKHRSVATAVELRRRLQPLSYVVNLHHRDIPTSS